MVSVSGRNSCPHSGKEQINSSCPHWKLLTRKMKQAFARARANLRLRRELSALYAMSDRELRDIGLIQQDVHDIAALSAEQNIKEFLASRQYDGTHYVMQNGSLVRRKR